MGCKATLEVNSNPACVAQARRLVDDVCGDTDRIDRDAARLLVSELVTNVLLHTDIGEGTMRIGVVGETLRVEVSDHGAGVPDRPRQPDPERGGGFGLFLVDRLSDRWGVRDRNCVWFELDRNSRGHPAVAPLL